MLRPSQTRTSDLPDENWFRPRAKCFVVVLVGGGRGVLLTLASCCRARISTDTLRERTD